MVRCPNCRSHYVEIEEIWMTTDSKYRVTYKCLNCGYRWTV